MFRNKVFCVLMKPSFCQKLNQFDPEIEADPTNIEIVSFEDVTTIRTYEHQFIQSVFREFVYDEDGNKVKTNTYLHSQLELIAARVVLSNLLRWFGDYNLAQQIGAEGVLKKAIGPYLSLNELAQDCFVVKEASNHQTLTPTGIKNLFGLEPMTTHEAKGYGCDIG